MSAGPYSIGSDHWAGMSKLIEEMGELQQVLGKIIAVGGDTHELHWDGSDLCDRLHDEVADVQAALDFFSCVNGLDQSALYKRRCIKSDLFEQWQEAQGG